jgi:D-alanyl-D-alanine carboxypeptidase/D-alanyl-D-alanine-endopeptidase (penicillin-binding protein 4)
VSSSRLVDRVRVILTLLLGTFGGASALFVPMLTGVTAPPQAASSTSGSSSVSAPATPPRPGGEQQPDRPAPSRPATSTAVGAAATPAPVPISGDSDTGAWTTGIPAVTSAGSDLAPTTGERATADASDLTWSIRARLFSRGSVPQIGAYASGQVVDVATGQVLWAKNPTVARAPASNQKVVTAFVALASMGASTRLTTAVLQVPAQPAVVYLKGSGDPALSSKQLAAMATTVATKVKGQGLAAVTVVVDDSLFPAPTNAAGWKPEWIPGTVAPVRALVADQVNVVDTSINAGQVLAAKLKAVGVTATAVRRGVTPSGATAVATTLSPTVGQLVQTMLNASQTDYAEALHRLSALRRGYPADWAGARANAIQVLTAAGIDQRGMVVNDGSGLSYGGRMTPLTAIDLVRTIRTTPAQNSVIFAATGMPTSGVSGTLKDRYLIAPTSCARSDIRAKTGTLADVVALSGVSTGVDGRERLFSVIVNGVSSTSAARADVDALAATSTGCY